MEFEKNLNELEKIADKLEDKTISLEEGIALYENGLELTKKCLSQLSQNKGKIEVIKKEMDRLLKEPFDGE